MSYLMHHGIKGQKWGVRRFQSFNGSLTEAGKKRYSGVGSSVAAGVGYSLLTTGKLATKSIISFAANDLFDDALLDGKFDKYIDKVKEKAKKIKMRVLR